VLDPEVFKAYDVRGLYKTELDEEGAYAISRAYVDEFSPARIAVGRDMRLSSPTMAAAVREGLPMRALRCSTWEWSGRRCSISRSGSSSSTAA